MLEAVALPLVKWALSEDVGSGDITTLNTLPAGINSRHVSHTSGPAGSSALSPCMPTTLTHRRPRRNRTTRFSGVS